MDSATIGQRLREIRTSRGYTAEKVEALTNRRFKASTNELERRRTIKTFENRTGVSWRP